MLRFTFLICILILQAACSLPVDLSPQQEVFLQLSVPPPSERKTENAIFQSLVVRDARADSFIHSHRILFSADPMELGYYQKASWVEAPTRQFTALLVEQLESSGIAKSVTRVGNSAVGEFLLSGEILEFYHDISSTPGAVKVKIRFLLVDAKRREVVGQRTFYESIPVEEFNSRGAVAAFSQACALILAEISPWLRAIKSSEIRINNQNTDDL